MSGGYVGKLPDHPTVEQLRARVAELEARQPHNTAAGGERERKTEAMIFVHCGSLVCPSNMAQRQVPGYKVERWWTAGDLDAGLDSLAGSQIERSTLEAQFLAPEDSVCDGCGATLHASLERRPVYGRLSGYDPAFLLKVARGQIPGVSVPEEGWRENLTAGAVARAAETSTDPRVSVLENELAELRKLLLANGNATAPVSPVEAPQSPVHSEDMESPSEDRPKLEPGLQWRGDRVRAYLSASEAATGRWTSVGTFGTVEEARVALDNAREEAKRGMLTDEDHE